MIAPCLRQTLRQPYAALRAPLFLLCFWAYAEPYATLTRAYALQVLNCVSWSAYAEPYATLTRAYAMRTCSANPLTPNLTPALRGSTRTIVFALVFELTPTLRHAYASLRARRIGKTPQNRTLKPSMSSPRCVFKEGGLCRYSYIYIYIYSVSDSISRALE